MSSGILQTPKSVLEVIEELSKRSFAFNTLPEVSLPIKDIWDGIDRAEIPPPTPNSIFNFEYTYDKLPVNFPDLNDIELPLVRELGVRESIEKLADYFECGGYKCNYVHFWFLDVITDCIWMCQDRFGFPEHIQKKVLRWILFCFDIIRDPSRNLTRLEFLKTFKETAYIASELIEEGCYEIPVPLQLVMLLPTYPSDEEKTQPEVPNEQTQQEEIKEQVKPEEIKEPVKVEEISEQTTSSSKTQESSSGCDSCIEVQIDQELNVHKLEKEICNCSITDTSGTNTAITDTYSSSVSSAEKIGESGEITKLPKYISNLYKADDSTPPRFKSNIDIPEIPEKRLSEQEKEKNENEQKKEQNIDEQKNEQNTVEQKNEQNIDDQKNDQSAGDAGTKRISKEEKISIELSGVSSRESTKRSIKDVRAFVVFQRPTVDDSVCSEEIVKEPSAEKVEEEEVKETKEKGKPKKSKDASKGKQSILKSIMTVKMEEPNKSISLDSTAQRKIMRGLKRTKMYAQRDVDIEDSKIGLGSWQIDDAIVEAEEYLSEEEEDDEDLEDEELLQLLNEQDIKELDEQEYLSFGVLWAIIDFVYGYFSDSFQYTLIKIALTAPPNIVTQSLNDVWSVPKGLKEDITKYIKDLADKYKRIPIKKKKEKVKKVKEKKAKKEKKEKKPKKEKKEKKPKLTKEEKKALKLAEKLRKKQEAEEEAARLQAEMNRIFLFPLQDADLEDEFFKTKFKNFKKIKIKGRGKKGDKKGGKKGGKKGSKKGGKKGKK